MATEVKRRRGSDSDHEGFTGAVAELTVNTDDWTVHVHDGTNDYGYPLLRQDFNNVPTTAPFTHITLDTAIFDTTYSETGSETQGTLYWNSDEETLSLVTNGESIELGQKVEIHVKNQTGAQIDKGEVVYASGTVGASGRILVTKMIADGTVAAKRVLGVAAENIANGADGKVIKFGKLRQIDTSTFSDGDILWVSTTVAGGFQNSEPVQADGEIALPIAYVVYSSASVGEIFIRVTPIDENEYQDYDAGLQDIAGLTPTDSNIIVGDGTNWVAESGATARASLGLTIGTHVQAWDAQLDTLSGLSANQATAIVAVTDVEYQQLQNIDSVTISNTQWGYLGALDQALATGDSPTFAGLTVDGLVVENEVRTLQSDVIENHLEIESLQDNKVEKGQLFPDGDEQALGTGDAVTFSTVNTGQGDNELYAMNQNVRTTDAVTFSTVDTGQGANELYAMNQDVQTTDDVTFNVVDVTDKIESASGFTSGVLGAGTIYDMDDGNGSFFEVDNMRIRNELRAHIFKKDIVKASNAYLFITDSAEVATTTTITDDTSTFRVVEDGTNASFNHQDLLWAKNLQDDGSLQATGVKLNVMVQPKFVWDKSTQEWDNNTSIPFTGYTEFTSGTDATSGKNFTEYNVYAVESSGTLNAGDTIVRVSGGNILNDASSQYSPFIDIYDGVTEWSHFQDVSKTKVRLGNLEGVSNTSGYGLFTENAFLTGALVVGDLTKAGNYLEYTGSTMNVVTDTFKLDSSTIDIDSSDTGSIALGAVPPTSHSSGAGIFFDGDGNALIGDNAGSYLKFDSANGIQIQLSGEEDDLSTAVAELRSDLINIHLSNESSFSGIQFLSGQLVLKAGTGNSIASITLDGTQEDVSTISLDADFIIVTGTTIFKSAKDGSTTPTNLGEATFIDGGTIVTDSITATEINVANLFAQEIEVTGKLKATDGSNEAIVGKLENIDINVQAAQGGVSNGDFYGFFINDNNYFGISDGDISSGNVLRVGDATNFLEFDGTNFTINTATFDLTAGSMTIDSTDGITIGANDFFKQDKTFSFGGGILSGTSSTVNLNTTTLVIDSATSNGKIALGATPPTGITSGLGIYFDGTGDALIGDATGNRIKFDFSASALEIQSDDFDLSAGNLLIDSGTTSLGGYTPTNATSIITNSDFSSTVTFNDNPLGGGSPSGDFGYLDDSVGWEADRIGSSTFSYDASGDYVQFTIDSSNGSNAVNMWQDEGWSDSGTSGTLSSYFGKTLTYTFDIRTAPTANGFQYGELFLRVYAYKNITDNTQASGYDYFQIAETKIVPSDLSGSSSTSIDVSAVIRDDYEAIRWSVEFDNFDTTSKAQDQYIFIYGVTLGAYDQTKVTLNSNGLSVFNSPIKQFTADSNGFEMVGMDIKTGGLQVPDIGSVQNLKTPDVGYLSVGAVDVGSSFRLYIKDSDGNAKYVTISTS